jgi:uncharacterized membrane protein
MDAYAIIKTVHILSATILFGTGLGTAFFFWRAHARGNETGRLAAARTTVLADLLFTTPAVVLQPVTGAWMIAAAGFQWDDLWLTATYALYAIAALCWLPVVAIQIRMKRMLERQAAGEGVDLQLYDRLFRIWFALGWPAFGGLVAVFFLMVMKPAW